MKTANAKKIFVSFVVISSIASPSFAKSLSDYRVSMDSLKTYHGGMLGREALSSKTDILEKLQVGIHTDLSSLQGTEIAALSSPLRLSYADSLRRFMDTTTRRLERDENYGKPTNFNPKWSEDDSRGAKVGRRQAVCEDLINKTDMPRLMTELELQANNSLDRKYSNIKVDLNKAKVLPAMNFALESLSKNKKSESVTQVLGNAVSFEVVNGQINEIQISKAVTAYDDSNTISLTIPMLASVMMDRDDRFVDSQNCLLKYLTEQKAVLETRKQELTNPGFAARVAKVKKTVGDVWAKFNSPEFAAERNKAKIDREGFFRYNLSLMSKDIPEARYLLNSSKHKLAKTEISAADELKLIDQRTGMLSNVIPFLKEKSKGAAFANKEMKRLSEKQRAELLALMLELRGRDIPTYADIAALRTEFVMNSGMKHSEGEIDYGFYKNIESSLTDLKMHLGVQ